ncbi:MAG: hypothetical protein KJO07_22270 [Deltaproteobacteria bacterium]|nr:hypothetical protein [Deltaproteobacteria bacterium]
MWKKCSSCRREIDFGAPYWKCSVSTCQRSRTALYFCSVPCWDAHLATANHREAWAVEARAPSKAQWQAEQAAETDSAKVAPARKTVGGTPRKVVAATAAASPNQGAPKDILIVVSKLKKYLREAHGMKTSDACAAVLSDYVRTLCDRAVINAQDAERKTVLDRDFGGVL